MLDAYCRFTAFSATSPGGTNDALAFLKWKFSKYLKDLMEAFIVLGDNAYVIDYNLLTPFDKCEMGADWRTKDVYNFYFSQLRIRIEMSFGLLVNKWGLLQKPLKVDISKVSHVIHVCMRLHNFCVDERMLDDSGYSVDNEIDNIIATTMTNPEDFFYCATVDSTMPNEINHSLGHSIRQMLVDRISSLNMTSRPASNMIRRFGTTTNR
ncbi:transposase family protein [uncultured Marinobacter sp.]|uniref:transposase family protein n=1 Tax=uncultured Marinobacter sp. TaxID=187379 RepID=UPI0025919B98|nr:transposase family protein [uncultured Marinobacter sp.]